MLKQTLLALSLGALAGTATAASHDTAQVRLVEDVSGTIKSVDAEKQSFVLEAGDEERTIQYGEATTFTLDGETVDAAAALAEGHAAAVTLEDGVAVSVAATSK